MRWLSCSMAVGCNWMQDCLKLVSLCSDTTFPLQAREFQWGSVSVNGSTNSSSQHCPPMGSWSRRRLISTMGGEPSRPCSLTKIWKKILTAGAPTRSVGRNCGKCPVNGCGTCDSHWDRRCKGARPARSNGHLSRQLLPFSCQRKARLSSMDLGSGQWHLDGPQGVSEPILSSCKYTERCAVQRPTRCATSCLTRSEYG